MQDPAPDPLAHGLEPSTLRCRSVSLSHRPNSLVKAGSPLSMVSVLLLPPASEWTQGTLEPIWPFPQSNASMPLPGCLPAS